MPDFVSEETKILSELLKAAERIENAQEELWAARRNLNDTWARITKECGGPASFPIAGEKVYVKDGSVLYEIAFDVDDWKPPTIERIDRYASVVVRKDW